ncbi:MAG: MFS transporter [Verrucomicrobia bacterium]|nr:MFS transporter [Verrucomicrobiota bacterium]
MLRLTPLDRIGEFYGLYGMVGRFSAITGPLVWAGMTAALYRLQSKGQPAVDALQEATWSRTAQGGAVLCLLVMMSVGYFILRPVSDQPQTLPRASH